MEEEEEEDLPPAGERERGEMAGGRRGLARAVVRVTRVEHVTRPSCHAMSNHRMSNHGHKRYKEWVRRRLVMRRCIVKGCDVI